MKKILLLALALVSCAREPLTVFTEYVSFESMPSYIVGTPDPKLYCPDYGEKLHLRWSMPKNCTFHTLWIQLDLRYGNGSFDSKTIELSTPTGIYVLPLLNEEYCEKEGVLTYRATFYGDGVPIKTVRHLLWVDPITSDSL